MGLLPFPRAKRDPEAGTECRRRRDSRQSGVVTVSWQVKKIAVVRDLKIWYDDNNAVGMR